MSGPKGGLDQIETRRARQRRLPGVRDRPVRLLEVGHRLLRMPEAELEQPEGVPRGRRGAQLQAAADPESLLRMAVAVLDPALCSVHVGQAAQREVLPELALRGAGDGKG